MFDAPGLVNEYVGGYDDWLRQRPNLEQTKTKSAGQNSMPAETKPSQPAAETSKPTKKLSYKDQREYDALPAKIESLESELEALGAQMADADFYQQEDAKVQAVLAELNKKEAELEQAFADWERLESLLN